jgi:drug/metabolite transporter (DMT)-like permease
MSATPFPVPRASGAAIASPRLTAHPRVLVALLTLWTVWSSTYLAMRVAVETLPPFAMAGTRYFVAGLILLVVLRVRGEPMPTRREWLLSIPLGALFFLVGNGLVVFAERSIPSSLAAIVCATAPLVASGAGAVVPAGKEKPSQREVLGMLLGLGGVALLARGSLFSETDGHAWLVLLAPVGWGVGSMIARRTGATGFSSAAAQMVSESAPAHVSFRAVFAWAYLVVVGSLVGFTAYVYLLRHARPAVAMSHAYVNPIFAVLLGAAIGGEPIGWTTLVSMSLIAAGVAASVLAKTPRRRA